MNCKECLFLKKEKETNSYFGYYRCVLSNYVQRIDTMDKQNYLIKTCRLAK